MTDVCLQCSVSVRPSPSSHPPICQCVRLHHHDKVFFETEIFLSSSIDMKTQKKKELSHDSQKWQYNRNHEEMLANQKHRNNDMAQSDMRKRHKNIHF